MKQRLLWLLFVSQVFAEKPSVIIVGAGVSGISAAVKLIENGITNIKIFEAEDRIGGRIHTVEFGDNFIDMGAQYCHGENVVYDTVKNLDLLEHAELFSAPKMYYSNGSHLQSQLIQDLETVVTNYDRDINRTKGVSLGEAFLEKYQNTILDKYKNDPETHKLASDGLIFAHSTILMHEGAFHWSRPASGRHYKPVKGDQMMVWKKRGYDMILDVLLKRYPDPSQKIPIEEKLFLKKKVTKISWSGTPVVELSDGTTHKADHVIVTPSVGVLTHEDLFDPVVPPRKQEAIKSMGFDGIIKIILYFPEKWWHDSDSTFFFLWDRRDLEGVTKEFSEGPNSWVTNLVALVRVPSNPHVLIGWVSGGLIPEMEKLPLDVIKKGSMFVIRKFLGRDYNITEPKAVLRSDWHNNPNFRGTYSYEKNGYFEEEVHYQDHLAEPLTHGTTPVVLFAGEATHPTHYSTVHGAIESGRREADRIIALYP
ncbi:peroxisomal N(1)-acetyl-spermine/spermidine oxidase-like [Tribolium madens]|uniref:peroxisomal N(1)-acetyl-spermine/spermidine oxidase-like n=1 Tax=Tribolium madens TaxID=41895 RepID=UPI001CF722C6|nr:peroxisomal N(1)-acetyl-spermine/spermidine oxidase-like [Tribolium madens]